MKRSENGLLRWIAVFKLLKAAAMIAVGIGILKLAHHNSEASLDRWVSSFGLDPDRGYIDRAIGKVVSIPGDRLKALGVGSFLYATLFLVEGTGLWLRRRWGEWVTVIITASLIPLEIYEIVRHPSAVKVLVLVLNLAIVVYLLVALRRERPGANENS